MTTRLLSCLGACCIGVAAFTVGLWVAPVPRDVPALSSAADAPPDPHVFAAARTGVEQHLIARSQTASLLSLAVDPRAGTIQSAWYSDHKGEVWLKVQVSVWSSFFRVDVYQRVGLVSPHAIRGSHWSTLTERAIQERISGLLESSARQ